MKSLHFIILCSIIVVISYGYTVNNNDKILLKDINTVLARKNEWTSGRRNSPIPQLICVGGDAINESNRVTSILCKNIGFDGIDVTWECNSVLDNDIKLGTVDVFCEGYDYPDDPFILKGSCAVEYTLKYSNIYTNTIIKETTETKHYDTTKNTKDDTIFLFFLLILIILVFIVIISAKIFDESNPNTNNYTRELVNQNNRHTHVYNTRHINPVPERVYRETTIINSPPSTNPINRKTTIINSTPSTNPINREKTIIVNSPTSSENKVYAKTKRR